MATSSKSLSLQEVINGIFASDSDTDSSESDSDDEIEDVDPCDRVSILFVDDNDTRQVANAPYQQETDDEDKERYPDIQSDFSCSVSVDILWTQMYFKTSNKIDLSPVSVSVHRWSVWFFALVMKIERLDS